MPTYRFTGPEPEDFPAPPIARRLFPGDVFDVAEPVEHARLELLVEDEREAGTEDDATTAGEPPAETKEE